MSDGSYAMRTWLSSQPTSVVSSKRAPLTDAADEARRVSRDVEAGLLDPVERRGRIGERPGSGGPTQTAGHLVHQRHGPGDVAHATALDPDEPAGPDEPCDLAVDVGLLVGRDPVQRGPAEHAVEHAVVLGSEGGREVLQRGLHERLVGAGTLLGLHQHRRLAIHADDMAARADERRDRGGQVAAAAAEVEQALTRLDRGGGEVGIVEHAVMGGVGRIRGAVPRRQRVSYILRRSF